MVLLVFLAIVWAAVGVYWLKTRVPGPSIAFGGVSRRSAPISPLASLSSLNARRSAGLMPMERVQPFPDGARAPLASSGRPGHSLTQPARRVAQPASGVSRVVSSDQARLRRRNVLVGLFGFAVLTLFGIFTLGGTTLVLVHLMADAMLLGFVLLIVQYQREIEFDRTRNRPVYAQPRRQSLAATGTDGRI